MILDFKNISIIDVVSDIVDSMRPQGGYTGATYDGTHTTVTASNSFKPFDMVMIGSIDYAIVSATSTTFKVKGDVTGETTYKGLAPYFAYGHILEIANKLIRIDKSKGVKKFEKYPIILLPLDVSSEYNQLFGSFDYSDVTIYIANKTEPTYTAADRLEHSFEPVLYPLYESFMEQLRINPNVLQSDNTPFPKHTKIDRFFWGTQLNQNSTKNILNDYLDCIEINKLKISIKNINC